MRRHFSIDIATRFISEEHRAYIVFPGDGYRYYSLMNEEHLVFLTIPGFEVPDTTGLYDSNDIASRLILSERIRDWHHRGCPSDDLPPRKLSELTDLKITRRRLQAAGVVRNFFSRLKHGDIVLVPPKKYDEDLLMGEIQEPGNIVYTVLPDYPGEKLPAIRVKWIRRVVRSLAPS